MPKVKSRTDSYHPTAEVLARISAATVAASRSEPPRTSLRALERMPRHSSCGARRRRDGEVDTRRPHAEEGGGMAQMTTPLSRRDLVAWRRAARDLTV